MATTAKREEQDPQAPETPDSPLLDLSDAAVKKLIKVAKSRGYITYDELNEVLPSNEVSSEQIEDIMAMLSDMGIKHLGRGQDLVQLIIGDIAARFGDLDKLLDRGIGEIQQRAVGRFGCLKVLFFTFCSRCHPLLQDGRLV